MNDTPETDGECTIGDLANGLLQTAYDHPCCKGTLHAASNALIEYESLVFAVRALKKAKGRFHTQQAAEALFKLLP